MVGVPRPARCDRQTIQIPFEFLGDAMSCRAAVSILWCQSVNLPSYVLLYVQTPSVYAMMCAGPCSVFAGLYLVYVGLYSECV